MTTTPHNQAAIQSSDSTGMPTPEANGFVKTLNNMGYMTSTLDPFSTEFAKFAAHAPGPALDIGAAYGVASLAALGQGAEVWANDCEPRHLEILAARVPPALRPRLRLLPGRFPDELELSDGSIGCALICRVMHFFDGPKIEESAHKLLRWLAPGGKVFVVAETPYLKNFRAFIPIYESRQQANQPWPGLVEDVAAIAPERGASLPSRMHFLDPAVLSRVFAAAGFEIETARTFARPDFPEDLQLDGRESVGLTARKPQTP